ncbi:MAG: MFS transporter [Bryobacteraceae bacterium]|nr:MFS transporter [Bryobacteraceae bacterium]
MRWRMFGLTWLAYAGLYLCRKNFSVLIPLLIVQVGLSRTELANAVFLYSAAYCVGQFTMGGLADKFGARLTVSVGIFISAIATASMSLWPTAIGISLLQMVNGMAQASGWPGLVKLMSVWFPRGERGVIMGWWSTNYVLGGFVATLLTTSVVTSVYLLPELGWRRGAIIPALALLPIGFAFAIFVRNRGESTDESQPFSWALVREVVRSPRIQVIAGIYSILKLTRYSFLFWLPLYMTEQLRYSAAEAGYTSAVFELAGFFGTLGAGYVSDKLMGSRRFPTAALMLAMLGGICMLHPILAAYSAAGNILGISVIGMMIFGPDTLLGGAAAQDAAPPGAVATAAGFINGTGSIGQMLSPWLVVWIAGQYGWNNLFYFFAALALTGSLVLTFSRQEAVEPVLA